MIELLILFGILLALGFVFILLPIYSVGYIIGTFIRGIVGGVHGIIKKDRDIRV